MRTLAAAAWIIGAWICLIQTGVPDVDPAPVRASLERESLRKRAIELVEDLVLRERFYHRRTGTFTPMLARLEFEIPEELRPYLQVQVVEAARNRLLVRAVSELRGHGQEGAVQFDQIWSNELFQMQASFPLAGRRLAKLTLDEPLPELAIEQIHEAASVESSAPTPSK